MLAKNKGRKIVQIIPRRKLRFFDFPSVSSWFHGLRAFWPHSTRLWWWSSSSSPSDTPCQRLWRRKCIWPAAGLALPISPSISNELCASVSQSKRQLPSIIDLQLHRRRRHILGQCIVLSQSVEISMRGRKGKKLFYQPDSSNVHKSASSDSIERVFKGKNNVLIRRRLSRASIFHSAKLKNRDPSRSFLTL